LYRTTGSCPLPLVLKQRRLAIVISPESLPPRRTLLTDCPRGQLHEPAKSLFPIPPPDSTVFALKIGSPPQSIDGRLRLLPSSLPPSPLWWRDDAFLRSSFPSWPREGDLDSFRGASNPTLQPSTPRFVVNLSFQILRPVPTSRLPQGGLVFYSSSLWVTR